MPKSTRKRKLNTKTAQPKGSERNDNVTGLSTPPVKRVLSRAISCEPCRKRKLRCDRVQPCTACVIRHEEEGCTWEKGTRPISSNISLDAADVLARIQSIESSITELTALVRQSHSPCQEAHAYLSYTTAKSSGKPSPPHVSIQPTALSFHCSDTRHTQGILLSISKMLPSIQEMKSMTDSFIVEVDYLDNIVGSALAHHHLKHVIKLQEQLSTQEDVIFDLDAAKVTQYTHSCALCLLIFASALTYASPTRQNYSCMPLKMAFINASVKALAALDVYGKPDLDFILISALLLTNFLYALKPWIAAEILYHAMNVCDRLNLHKEPATSTPFDEARRNVTWFALLCASDWDLTSTLERKPIVYYDKEQFPSLFGTDEDRSRYLSHSILARLLCARLSYRTMVISRSGRRTPEEVHKLHNDILDAMAMFQSVIHASALGYEDTPNIVKARFAVAALHFLLIRLHVPDYTRAWSDKQFHISKITCLESSVFLLHLFRDIFQVPLSCCEQGTQGPFSRIANYFQFSSRWCCVAALLLVKHFTLTLETGCDEIPSSRAAAIVQDLRILCKILQFLSPPVSDGKRGVYGHAASSCPCARSRCSTACKS